MPSVIPIPKASNTVMMPTWTVIFHLSRINSATVVVWSGMGKETQGVTATRRERLCNAYLKAAEVCSSGNDLLTSSAKG